MKLVPKYKIGAKLQNNKVRKAFLGMSASERKKRKERKAKENAQMMDDLTLLYGDKANDSRLLQLYKKDGLFIKLAAQQKRELNAINEMKVAPIENIKPTLIPKSINVSASLPDLSYITRLAEVTKRLEIELNRQKTTKSFNASRVWNVQKAMLLPVLNTTHIPSETVPLPITETQKVNTNLDSQSVNTNASLREIISNNNVTPYDDYLIRAYMLRDNPELVKMIRSWSPELKLSFVDNNSELETPYLYNRNVEEIVDPIAAHTAALEAERKKLQKVGPLFQHLAVIKLRLNR